MAAPSSSSFDVFLNFRGEDTRFGFTSHLRKALRQSRIHVFMDDAGIGRGEEISGSLLQTIERSRIAIVIFSPQYASSRWCLDELVKIMECRTTQAQVVIPVFFKVDLSHVHDQTATYDEAMKEHEQRLGRESDRVLRWRQALTAGANIPGHNSADRYESELVEKVVHDVLENLQPQVHEELTVERTNYDVFLNFCGQDTRLGFTSHLYRALRRIGIHAFKDDEGITSRRGEEIGGSIQQAIERSRIALVIFSPKYACSPWRLNELVKIMECKRAQGLVVIPIFHRVELFDVRQKSGSYGEAMRRHNDNGMGIDQVERWREALTAATSIAGFNSSEYRYESEMVEEIVEDVSNKLRGLTIVCC